MTLGWLGHYFGKTWQVMRTPLDNFGRISQSKTEWNRWNRVKQGETGWNKVKQSETGWNRVKQGETEYSPIPPLSMGGGGQVRPWTASVYHFNHNFNYHYCCYPGPQPLCQLNQFTNQATLTTLITLNMLGHLSLRHLPWDTLHWLWLWPLP